MSVIECVCPPKDGQTRHPDGDTVTLRERLDFHAATTIRQAIAILKSEDPDSSAAEILATLTEHYVLFGVESWSLVDEKDKPVPVSRAAIRSLLLTRPENITDLADEADGLYQAQVLLPLLARASKSSPPSPIDGSTSAKTPSGPKPRKPSRLSLTTTSPTDGTATTSSSLVGVSNFSPSSESAA